MKKMMFSIVILFTFTLIACNASTQTNREELEKITVEKTTDEVVQGDFIFRIVSEKAQYQEGEEVQLYGEIEYIGDEEEIQIFHSSSAIIFDLYEKTRGYEIGGAVNDIGVTTSLKKGIPYRETYEKSGGYSEDDPKAYVQFMENFFKRKDFPMGFYEVKAHTDFSVAGENEEEHDRIGIEAKIEFKVVD